MFTWSCFTPDQLKKEKWGQQKLLERRNCPSTTIHHSKHGDLICFCHSFLLAVISLPSSWGFHITAHTSYYVLCTCIPPTRTHTHKEIPVGHLPLDSHRPLGRCSGERSECFLIWWDQRDDSAVPARPVSPQCWVTEKWLPQMCVNASQWGSAIDVRTRWHVQ